MSSVVGGDIGDDVGSARDCVVVGENGGWSESLYFDVEFGEWSVEFREFRITGNSPE